MTVVFAGVRLPDIRVVINANRISIDIIIIIEASYDEIYQRRWKDIEKNRVLEDYETVKEHMSLLKYSMTSISAILGSNLMILKNDDFQTCLRHLKVVLKG